MNIHSEIKTEREVNLPRLEVVDVVTILSMIIIGSLLMTDRQVPEVLLMFASLGTGIKVNTEGQLRRRQQQ